MLGATVKGVAPTQQCVPSGTEETGTRSVSRGGVPPPGCA